jgi:hypothetical protein
MITARAAYINEYLWYLSRRLVSVTSFPAAFQATSLMKDDDGPRSGHAISQRETRSSLRTAIVDFPAAQEGRRPTSRTLARESRYLGDIGLFRSGRIDLL